MAFIIVSTHGEYRKAEARPDKHKGASVWVNVYDGGISFSVEEARRLLTELPGAISEAEEIISGWEKDNMAEPKRDA